MAKYVKTIKKLSDGTIAKVGMLVTWFSIEQEMPNDTGRIEKIRIGEIFITNKGRKIRINGNDQIGVNYPNGEYSTRLDRLRKATKEEKRDYYEQAKIHSNS